MEKRGIRNNNPGNLNFSHQPGAVLETVPRGEVARFAAFSSPEAGLLALRNQLLLYNQRDHLDTVNEIIGKFAPSNENDTYSYICGVAHALGVGAFERIGKFTPPILASLMKAIIQRENGENPYGELVDHVAGVLTCGPGPNCS